MIEIKNLTKIYKVKKGDDVQALKHISLNFLEKGLIFIVGKSGSGKSTLLNLIGALDSFDDGDIIVNGQSIKNLKEPQLDSYRNTCLAFVFQEFNLLNEFNIKENISLPLELQNKKISDEEIESLLKKVDLEDYSNRKPNELSGGQKQRVAIARALVKNTNIILADEPSGSLDNETGKQIFQILKDLSKEKLIIVASHNIEFANLYGDKIIELSFGEIKEIFEPNKKEKVLLSKGESFNIEDILKLKEQFKDKELVLTEKGVVIKEEKIEEENGEEVLEKNETNTGKVLQFIKSKLPLTKAIKIGITSFKAKPIRLAFTVLLSFLSFSLFSFSSAIANFNKIDIVYNNIVSDNISYFQIDKEINSFDSYVYSDLNNSDIGRLNNDFGIDSDAVFSFDRFLNQNLLLNELPGTRSFNGFVYVSNEKLSELDFSVLAGKYPSESNEIAITDYEFEYLKKVGIITYNEEYEEAVLEIESINKPSDVLNKLVDFDGDFYRICGIINTNATTKYPELINDVFNLTSEQMALIEEDFELSSMLNSYHDLISNTYANSIFVSKQLYEQYLDYYGFNGDVSGFTIQLDDEDNENKIGIYSFASSSKNKEIIHFFDNQKQSIDQGEIVLPISFKYMYAKFDENLPLKDKDKTRIIFSYQLDNNNAWIKHLESISFSDLSDFKEHGINSYIFTYVTENLPTGSLFEEFCIDFYKIKNGNSFNEYEGAIDDDMKRYAYYVFVADFGSIDINKFDGRVEEEILDYLGSSGTRNLFGGLTYSDLLEDFNNYLISNYGMDESIEINISAQKNHSNVEVPDTLTLVGYYLDNENEKGAIVSDDFFDTFVIPEERNFECVYAQINDKNSLKLLIEDSYNQEINERFSLVNSTMRDLNKYDGLFNLLKNIFIIVGAGLCIFSLLIFMNFISASIVNKKKEIGILKSLGARNSDVFKIFFVEGFVVAISNFVFSVIATSIAILCLNMYLSSILNISGSIFIFGYLEIFILIALCLVSSVIATLLPTYFISRKKPIEAINDK